MTLVAPELALPRARASLVQRLDAVAAHIVDDAATIDAHRERGAGVLLDLLARTVREREDVRLVWLLLAAVLSGFPDEETVTWVRRRLWIEPAVEALGVFLQAGMRDPIGLGDPSAEIEVVDAPVVDVNFCARYAHNTGIQRVVRETVSRWVRDQPDIVLVAWNDAGTAMRRLSELETGRVISWNAQSEDADDTVPSRIVIPFGTDVVLPEVPQAFQSAALTALAAFSGNDVAMIGYDMIPVVSPNTVAELEIEKFSHYLGIVKRASTVVAISETAAREFGGFASARAAQGLPGPRTSAVSLPIDVPTADEEETPLSSRPLVLCVGSQEPRKNHEAILFAAEMLWREGLDFSLEFIGGGSADNIRRFDRQVRELRGRGRPILVRRGVGDAELLSAYAAARFTVFPSIHEGYGLPVAESIATGTPAITSDYGSTGEIGADGGCLLINPRDDGELVSAMRRLLVDDELLRELRAQIRARPRRTWDDYAAEVWAALVEEPA